MKAWKNQNQFEAHIDEVLVQGDKITFIIHAHLDGSAIENAQLLAARELEKHKILTTFAKFMQIPGLNEKKKDLPGQTGGEKVQ